MTEIIELETKRLRLRQWRPQDREPFAALNADPRVMQFFPHSLNRAASDDLVDRIQALIAERGWGFWAVEKIEDQSFIGFVGLHEPAAELPFSPCVEIGWRLGYPYWGQGFATEAARAALNTGFTTLGLEEIVSFTTLANVRSRAVMERLGMQDAKEDFDHPGVPVDSGLRRHCLYRISRKQWKKGNIAIF